MSRIRSILPGIWTDEAFASLPDGAALLYIGLLNEADDNGVFEWKPVTIKMRLRPATALTPSDIEAMLVTIEVSGMVRRYELDGKKYGAVRNFVKWQRPKSPKGVHPTSEDIRNYLGFNEDGSRPRAGTGRPPSDETSEPLPNSPGTTSEQSCQREEGGGKREEEEGRESNARARPISPEWKPKDPKSDPAEVARFVSYNVAKGTVMADWDAAWDVWLSRTADFGKAKAQAPPDTPAADVVWLSEDDPRWGKVAARHRTEKGKPLLPTTSKHGNGYGAFLPRADYPELSTPT